MVGNTVEEDNRNWLEKELYALGQQVRYPPVPFIVNKVQARLLQQRVKATHRPFLTRPALLRMAIVTQVVLLVCLATALALVPTTRQALAEFFGLQRIRVIRVTETPVPIATPVPIPVPAATHLPLGATPSSESIPTPMATLRPTPIPSHLAGGTTLAEARHRVNFAILLPTYPEGIGEPDEVYVQELYSSSDVQVILVYRVRPDLAFQPLVETDTLFTLYQFRTQGIFMKVVRSGTRLAELTVDGAKAFWLQGDFHLLKYRDASGQERVEMERVVKDNTLAWEVGDVTYRLETSLPLEEALKIARSLR